MGAGGKLPFGALARLAWRNLWRNRRRTAIMLLAIATGAWAMIFMTALMRGMVDQMVEDGIDALPGAVQVHHPRYRDDPNIENSLAQPGAAFDAALDGAGIRGWTARVRVPAMVSSARDSRGVTLLGVDPAGEIAVGFDPASVTAGRFLDGPADGGVVLGRKLLERLETDLGKRVVLMSQGPDNDVADRGFRVVGVYEAQLEALEETFVYAGRDTVQAMLERPGRVSEIAVSAADYRDVGALLERVRAAAGPEAEVRSWIELDPYLGSMMTVMDGFVLVWIVVIFLALSFGLVNTLMMAVFERIREFGLMQALGMKPAAILWQVLLESLLLLVLGLALGNLLAVASVWPLRDGLDLSIVGQGMEWFGAAAVLYPALKPADVLLADAVVVVLGILTSLLPAWRASRYRPVDAIARA
jgi:ABC-type lipoprotein release transport system permease subunit